MMSETQAKARCDPEEERKKKLAIEERQKIEKRAEMAVHLIEYYGGNVQEAAKAVGVKRAALEGYRDGTVRCNLRKRLLLEQAIRVADTPPEDKQQSLWQMYEKMADMLEEKKPVKDRFELSAARKYRDFLEKLISMLKLLREHLHCLPQDVVDRLYWRAEKHGLDVMMEAHIQARGKRPQDGLTRVAEKMLFTRLQEASRSGVLAGFRGIPVANAPQGTGEQNWMDGLFLAACSNATQDGTDADIAYIPRVILRKYPGLTQRGQLATTLWFLPDEDNIHVHINYAELGKKALRENEIEVEDTQVPCAVRIPRAECLLFASKYHNAPSCTRADVYNIRMHPSGLTTIDEKAHAIYPMVSPPSASPSMSRFNPKPEILQTYLSKLEVFFGVGPAVHDLVEFVRSPLQAYADEERRKAMEAEGLEETPSFTLTEELESFSDEEEEISLDGDDPRVGTILMRIPGGDNGVSTLKERRYVYCSVHNKEEPYYLSKTFNRIFLIDKERIEYFPNGVEPPEIRRAMRGWPNNTGIIEEKIVDHDKKDDGSHRGHVNDEDVSEEEEEDQPVAAESNDSSGEALKVGTIKVKIAKDSSKLYPEAGEDEYVLMDVFQNSQFKKPYYLTYTGNKIFIVDPSRIIPAHPPRPKKKRRPVVV